MSTDQLMFPFRFYWRMTQRGWLVLDVLLAAGVILLAYGLQPQIVFGWDTSNPAQPGAFQAALIYPWFVLISMHVAGLHDPLGDRRWWITWLRVTLAIGAALLGCLLLLYFVSLQQFGRTILFRTYVFSVLALSGARIGLWRLAQGIPRRIGCHMSPAGLARFRGLLEQSSIRFDVVAPEAELAITQPAMLVDFFLRQKVDEVVVSARDEDPAVWHACLNSGIQVTDLTLFCEREFYRMQCDELDPSWCLRIDLKLNHPYYHRLKRLVDIGISLPGLLLSLPIVALAGLATLIESGQPLFYSQIRMGLRGRSYQLWKLRTMRVDAEKNGAQWAQRDDARVTRVGRVLRLTRIDELPQFWNVLKGEMSLIGPRPERPEFVEELSRAIPGYAQRHWVKPGITGWAQINYPYGASVADSREKLCYDLYYLKNASILLDMHIALRTVGVLMKGSR